MMYRKPTYRVYVEEGPGGAMSHVAELPGCFAVGSNASKAVAATPKAIRDFLLWLRSHREPLVPEAHIARPNLADIAIVEVRTEGAPMQAGSKATLFEFDAQVWSAEKLERTLRWLHYSRADLLAAIDGRSEEEVKATQIASDRTIWDVLWHVANAEYGYINCLAGHQPGEEPVTDNEPSHILRRLALIREILERCARAIPPDKQGEIVYPTWSDYTDEPWTLQKALRRALEHEREHLSELRW